MASRRRRNRGHEELSTGELGCGTRRTEAHNFPPLHAYSHLTPQLSRERACIYARVLSHRNTWCPADTSQPRRRSSAAAYVRPQVRDASPEGATWKAYPGGRVRNHQPTATNTGPV